MSSQSAVTVHCNHCQQSFSVPIWESINTVTNPELKSAVRDRSAFIFECPNCSEKSYLDYSFMYHQQEDKIVIDYAANEETVRQILSCLQAPKEDNPLLPFIEARYIIRIVRSQNRLIEKLQIFDDGLDDRIIEIYKALALLNYDSEHPDADNPEIYYNQAHDGSRQLQVFIKGKYECSTLYNEQMYNNLKKQFGAKLPDICESWPLIDEKWAMRLLTEEDN